MTSILYNLSSVTERVYRTCLDEFLEHYAEISNLLEREGIIGTVRIDSGYYTFLTNSSIQYSDTPFNHIIACVDNSDSLESLIQNINELFSAQPLWEGFEIDDDAINAENIQLLDNLSFRKAIVKYDVVDGKGIASSTFQQEVKMPTTPIFPPNQ